VCTTTTLHHDDMHHDDIEHLELTLPPLEKVIHSVHVHREHPKT